MSRIAVIGIVGNSVFLPVDRFHVGGETVEAHSIHFELGGKGFNQAVAAARCGAVVSFCAAVGRDLSNQVNAFLTNEGVAPHLIEKDSPSAFAAIVTDTKGANRVTVYQGCQLTPGDVLTFEDEIKRADILLLSNEVTGEVNAEAIKIASKYGTKCILNPAPARTYPKEILDQIQLFTPNEHETEGIEDRCNCIVTLGKRGCLIKQSNTLIPAQSKGSAIDTTGAGDTFNGVLCALIAQGASLEYAARAANAVAALGVTRKYAVSSIPTTLEINQILKGTEIN